MRPLPPWHNTFALSLRGALEFFSMLALSALAPEIEFLHFLAERQRFYCLIFYRFLCASIANVAETGVLTTSPEAFELLWKRSTAITSFVLSEPFSLVAFEFELPLLRLGIAHIRGTRARVLLSKRALELRARAPSSAFGVLHEESDCFMIWFFLRPLRAWFYVHWYPCVCLILFAS